MDSSSHIWLIVAPAAGGKDTLAKNIQEHAPHLHKIVTYTTRQPRHNHQIEEVNGVHYHFVSEIKFKELIAEGFFLEYALVHGTLYGTPLNTVRQALANKEGPILLVIDYQGATNVMKEFPDQAFIVFLDATDATLHSRLLSRTSAISEDEILVRLDSAKKERAWGVHMGKEYPDHFMCIHNDSLSPQEVYEQAIQFLEPK